MGRRTILLLSALLLAAFGTFAVFAYVKGVDDRAQRDLDPVKVLVANERIAAGTTAAAAEEAGALRLERLPRKAVPEGALSSTAPIADMVAASDIFPGEQILLGKWSAAGTLDTLPIPAGKVAASIQLGDPQRVAGFVRPGSEVAIFVTIAPAGTAGAAAEVTQVLLPKVTVLAVGPTTIVPRTAGETPDPQANTEQLPTAILTLALDQTEAQKTIFASQKGQLYFALLGDESNVVPGPGVSLNNLFA